MDRKVLHIYLFASGTPGGPWSEEELLVVKSKLYGLFKNNLAPKALRLSFHDCMPYPDGTGGCDGCINWEGVDVVIETDKYAMNITHTDVGANNGLGDVVRELELVYTEVDYPSNTLTLGQSLKDSGKSRADLWAYAAIVAVEWGIEANNLACVDWDQPNVPNSHCVHEPGTEECFVRPARPIQFEYGRADCTEHDPEFPYKSLKKENHPDAEGNGQETIKYFKDNFDFSGRETAAIFGAHTFGKPHVDISLFPYTWTSSAVNIINNDYYKNIVGRDRWFINDKQCRHVPDAYGNKPKTRWLTHSRKMTTRGGPVFWIHENHCCPSLYNQNNWSAADYKCVEEAGPGQYCRPDPPAGSDVPRLDGEEDGDMNKGCERFKLIPGADEIALNCEMGLYLDFQVTDGVPHGCPGLEHFKEEMASDKKSAIWSKPAGSKGKAQPECGKQMIAEPEGSTPVYKIMEEFADDNNVWIDAFTLAMEKMMRKGYSGLQATPDVNINQECPIPKRDDFVTCYTSEEVDNTQVPFMIGSRTDRLDGKVLQYDSELDKFLFSEVTGNSHQLWRLSVENHQLINEFSGKPYIVEGVARFEINTDGDDYVAVNPVTGLVVNCWAARREGRECNFAEDDGSAAMRFHFIMAEK